MPFVLIMYCLIKVTKKIVMDMKFFFTSIYICLLFISFALIDIDKMTRDIILRWVQKCTYVFT